MDGILLINKGKSCTSHDVVYKVKKLFSEKVGHTGTLDPNATGVLPILIGKGTKVSEFLINHDKKYIATIRLGIKTDTADGEGNIIEEKNVDDICFDIDVINRAFTELKGKQKQKPPMYSAIKVNGKKLYEYARSGKTVDVPARDIEIYDLKLININKENQEITFEIFCSKGTYVRTVCEQIAEELGTVGFMKELKRTLVGDFKIENSITIEELQDNFNNHEFINEKVISMEQFFESKEKIVLNDKDINLLLNGVMIESNCNSNIVRVYDNNGVFIGIGTIENGKLKRKIIFAK